jgi:hypothetical protein
LVRRVKVSGVFDRLNLSDCLNFSVHLSCKAPDCPYSFLPCKKFLVYLGYAVCSKGETRCSELPLWASNGCNLAVLRGQVLHV